MAGEGAKGQTPGQLNGKLLGRYRVEALLGRGGTAAVYRATDPASARTVAIKVPDQGLERDPQFSARFLHEVRAMARLQHPYIVPIYDVGEQDGRVFLVTQYVEGGTLRERLGGPSGAAALPPADAVALLRPIALALDYAHAQGIVHRGVKPTNILLPAKGHPLLADFGIAKVLEESSPTSQTPNLVLGTVEYMSPEQGLGLPLDGRADLYSLGVILYEALTARPPFQADARHETYLSVLMRHVTATPPAPRVLNPALSPALEGVLLRALTKHASGRYPTGVELFAALDGVLDERTIVPLGPAWGRKRTEAIGATSPVVPVPAAERPTAPPSRLRRVSGAVLQQPDGAAHTPPADRHPEQRRGRRHLPRRAGAALLVLLLSAGLLAAILSARGARRAVLTAAFGASAPAPAATAAVAEVAAPRAPTAVAGAGVTPEMATTSPATVLPITGPAATIPPIAAPTVTRQPGVATATTVPAATAPFRGQAVAARVEHTSTVASVAWSPDGRVLASSADDGTIRLWTPNGNLLATLTGHRLAVKDVVWSPDATSLASSSYDGTARLWTREGQAVAVLSGHSELLTKVAWTPDGRRLATASADDTVRLWDARGQPLAVLTGHTSNVEGLAWSPDSTALASSGMDTTVRLWNSDGGSRAVLIGHTGPVWNVAWSPDGKTLASGSSDGTVRLWGADGRGQAVLTGHTDTVTQVVWSPNGQSLASASWDTTVRLWTAAGQARATLAGHTDSIYRLAWSPDSATLASGSKDSTVRLWSAEGRPLATLSGHRSTVWGLAWSPDGATLASGAEDFTVQLWR